MHILFETHGLNEFGESETYKAFRIVKSALSYAEVTVVMPERWVEKVPSLTALGARIIPVSYDSRRYPLNTHLEYRYGVFGRQVVSATESVMKSVDVVHRLNPNAVRFCSPIAFAGPPFVIGPLGWSRLPSAWMTRPAVFARNVLKSFDVARIRADVSCLHRMYERATAITLVNEAALEAFPKAMHSKCFTTYEWIDTKCYPQFDAPSNKTPVILFVGRLIPHKGVEYLIDALARCLDVDWHLRVLGDGPMLSTLKKRAVERGIDRKVSFLGRVPREEVISHYRDADFCCFPGLNESSGNVNVEAMACGRPVIVADWAGPREIVSEGCGIRVPVDSPRALVDGLESALRLLIEDESLRVAMGRAGRERAVRVYDVQVAMGRFKELHLAAFGEAALPSLGGGRG